MSDDFQRGLQARLAHLIGEASQWSRGSGAHPPGLVKALNEAFEYGCAEIERLRRERDQYKLAAELNAETIRNMQRERSTQTKLPHRLDSLGDCTNPGCTETCAHQHPDRKPDDTYCRDCGEHF